MGKGRKRNKHNKAAKININSDYNAKIEKKCIKSNNQLIAGAIAQIFDSKQEEQIKPEVIEIASDTDSEVELPAKEAKKMFTLSKLDLKTLKSKTWLNDNIIDASLKLFKEKYDKKNIFYVSSSFFFTRIKNAKNNDEGYYTKTKKWFKGVDLLEKKFWLVPVCEGNHWFLIVVQQPGKQHCRVLIFDSMRSNSHHAANIVRNFLKKKYLTEEQRGIYPKISRVEAPLQNNSYDCGLHLLRSAELIFKQKQYFTKTQINEFAIKCEKTPLLKRRYLKKQLYQTYMAP